MPPKSAKKWLSVTIACPDRIVEAAADLLGVLSGVGVEIKPPGPAGSQDITGFFSIEGDGPAGAGAGDAAVAEVMRNVNCELEKLFALYDHPLDKPLTQIIDDQDWATSWQQYFTPTEIVPGLVIKPSWEEYAPGPGQHVIEMDPGMAFGTGQHESTRLALGLLASCFEEPERKPERVLDIGTGTGILAMGAAAFGAKQITAIDNDPEAVGVALENAGANHFSNIDVSITPLAEIEGSFDLIFANIVHDVLVEMAPEIGRLADRGCAVILAGILAGEQERNIIRLYRENGMNLVRAGHEGEWAGLLLRKAD